MDTIVTKDLSRSFGSNVAVDRISLQVAQGELFGLVGPDGAGKTTTLRMLASILDPSAGDAWVAGFHTVREADRVKDSIGYMSQAFGLYADLTVQENIDFFADIYGAPSASRADSLEKLLGFSGLAPFRKRLAGKLSGGMKQKLALACALIHTPRVLLLDEPTNGVDPVSRHDFWRILRQLLVDGVTILLSTSYLDEAERCTRLALMHHGRILAHGTPDAIRQRMTEAIVELKVPEPRRCAALLRAGIAAADVCIFGDRIHLVTRDPDRATAEARRILDSAGIGILGCRRTEPSLEDVFVAVVGAAETGAPS